MARGEAQQTKIHFKGKENEFIIFVDDAKASEEWRAEKSTPLVQVVKSFKIFVAQKYVSTLCHVSSMENQNGMVTFHKLDTEHKANYSVPRM